MLERLRIQEVSEIIFTVPEGAIIADTGLKVGEPVMIIKNPGTSKLLFSINLFNLSKVYLLASKPNKASNPSTTPLIM